MRELIIRLALEKAHTLAEARGFLIEFGVLPVVEMVKPKTRVVPDLQTASGARWVEPIKPIKSALAGKSATSKGVMRRLTPQEQERLSDLWVKQGLVARAIAKRLKCKTNTVYYYARLLNLPKRNAFYGTKSELGRPSPGRPRVVPTLNGHDAPVAGNA
jgi:hypothetical protein